MNNQDKKSIVDTVKEYIPDVQGIYLFGSFATGDANNESDMDIALLCKHKLAWELKSVIVDELSDLLQRDIDLVELRYVDTIFKEEIIKTAKRIAELDKLACELYEDYIYCSAMDFREFRKPHVEEIIARGSVYG